MEFKKYRKAIVAAAGVGVVVCKALVDGQITPDEVLGVIVAVGVAVGVYQVPNKQ